MVMSIKVNKDFKYNLLLFLIILCGYIARLLYIIKYSTPSRDSYLYLDYIIKCVKNDSTIIDEYSFPPLGIWILSLPYRLFQYDILKGGIILNLILGLVIIYLFVYVGSTISKRKYLSLLCGLIVSFSPSFIKFSCTFLRENLYIFFLLLFVLNAIKNATLIGVILSGLLTAILINIRYESFELIVYYLVYLGYLHYSSYQNNKKTKQLKRGFTDLTVFVFSIMLFWGGISLLTKTSLDYYAVSLFNQVDRTRLDINAF